MFLVINDPNYMAGMGYCYFVFRKWISPGKMSPDRFGATVTGFSILNEKLSPYQKWIETSPEGKSCKAKVKSESGVVAANLEVSIRGHSAIIVLNPYAFVQDKSMTYAQILKEMVLTTNHERIHAYQVLCPEFEKKAAEAWSALSAKKQAEFRSAHEGYDWDDAKVASREFFAFEFERTPEKIAPLVSAKCRIGDR